MVVGIYKCLPVDYDYVLSMITLLRTCLFFCAFSMWVEINSIFFSFFNEQGMNITKKNKPMLNDACIRSGIDEFLMYFPADFHHSLVFVFSIENNSTNTLCPDVKWNAYERVFFVVLALNWFADSKKVQSN